MWGFSKQGLTYHLASVLDETRGRIRGLEETIEDDKKFGDRGASWGDELHLAHLRGRAHALEQVIQEINDNDDSS